MNGLGVCVDEGGDGGLICYEDGSSAPASTGPGINWNQIIGQLTSGGLKIAQMQATPTGYVQQASGAFANYGPGGGAPGIGGISTSTLLIGGGLLVALLAFGGRK